MSREVITTNAGSSSVSAAEAVGRPCAHARPAGLLAAGEEKGNRRRVIHRRGVHRFDEAQLVRDAGHVRQIFPQPRAGLTVLPKGRERRQHQLLFLPLRHRRKAFAAEH